MTLAITLPLVAHAVVFDCLIVESWIYILLPVAWLTGLGLTRFATLPGGRTLTALAVSPLLLFAAHNIHVAREDRDRREAFDLTGETTSRVDAATVLDRPSREQWYLARDATSAHIEVAEPGQRVAQKAGIRVDMTRGQKLAVLTLLDGRTADLASPRSGYVQVSNDHKRNSLWASEPSAPSASGPSREIE